MPQYLAQCEALGRHGWDFKFFVDPAHCSPGAYWSTPSVELVPMTLGEFDDLVERTLGVRVRNVLVGPGDSPAMTGQPRSGDLWPRKLMSCYYPMHGAIFADWVRGYDFHAGYFNWDVVLGRLDRFATDELLASCDVFSDEPDRVNGVFTVCRNDEHTRNLFREIPNWERKLAHPGPDNPHVLDEHEMTLVCRRAHAEGRVRFITSQPTYLHCHDTWGTPPLARAADGGLHVVGSVIGSRGGWARREYPFYHFKATKRWPDLEDLP